MMEGAATAAGPPVLPPDLAKSKDKPAPRPMLPLISFLGPVFSFVMTYSVLLNCWYASVWSPWLALSTEEVAWARSMCWAATFVCFLQTWCLVKGHFAKIIPLPAERDMYIGSISLEKLKEGGADAVRDYGGYCSRCKRCRPKTTHHCRICGGCVMEFDHHCPALGTCVGTHNYKYFFLFICYTAIASTITLAVLYQTGHYGSVIADTTYSFVKLQSLKDMRRRIVSAPDSVSLQMLGAMLTLSNLCWSVAMVGFSFIHLGLILTGHPTLTYVTHQRSLFRDFANIPREKKGVLLMRLRNVFGRGWWQWLFPVVKPHHKNQRIATAIRPFIYSSSPV